MHVLLIEDHPKYREQLAVVLQKHFAEIASLRTAGSFDEAVAAIEADHPLDLVVTDTQLIRGDSTDVLCHVTRFGYHVVCMSTDERDYRVKKLKQAGFSFYCKLDDIQKLIALIEIQMAIPEKTIMNKIEILKRIIKQK